MPELRGRVGLVYPRAGLDSVPMLFNSVELLARHGYAVEVFTEVGSGMEPPEFSSPLVTVHPLSEPLLPETTILDRARANRIGRIATVPLRRGYARLQSLSSEYASRKGRERIELAVDTLHRTQPFTCLIGVDADGVSLASELAAPRRIPVAYVSLELLLWDELTTVEERRLKSKEYRALRAAPFSLIQDQSRGRLLVDDNGLDPADVLLVPNAPLGPARREPSPLLRTRLGIPQEKKIVLHSGSLGDWTGIEDIVRGTNAWPDSFVLVIHTRYDANSSSYVDQLRAMADPRRVYFSLNPLPRDEYDALVDGADVGIAFYVASADSSFTGANVATLGLSSGKLAYYSRSGLPSVVNKASSVAGLVETADCGLAVEGGAQVGEALREIEQGYSGYSERAVRFFHEKLDFERPFGLVLERIDALSKRQESA